MNRYRQLFRSSQGLPNFAGLVTLTLSAFFFAPSLHAETKPTPEPTTTSSGHDISANVLRGGACELVLEGIAMPGEKVDFKIKSGPDHGTLEGPKRISRDRVSYLYRHNGKKGEQSDRIDFKLKTAPENPWGPITARIAIVEPASSLALEREPLDFGAVPIGEKRSLPLKIKNAGGGILSGKVKVGAPWSLAEAPEFELAEGESREFRVLFAPVDAAEVKGRIEFQSGSKPYHSVNLSGEGVYRFEVPDRVSIEKKPDGDFLEILNSGSEDLALRVDAPAPLVCPPQILVPAGRSEKLKLGLRNGTYSQKSVDISLLDGPVLHRVRVDLPPSPAVLEWENGPLMDVGQVPFRHVPEMEIRLKNAGATNAMVRLAVGDGGLRLAPSQAPSFELRQGETALVKTVWNLPEAPGEARAKLSALEGGLTTDLEFLAVVEPPGTPPVIESGKKITPTSPEPIPHKQVLNILTEAEKKELGRRMPADITTRLVVEHGAATAILTWKYGGPKSVKFTLERKVTVREGFQPGKVFEKRLEVPEQLPANPVLVKWMPVDDKESAIESADGIIWQGRVPGLETGYNHIRIAVRAPPDGKRIDSVDFTILVGKLPRPAWVNWSLGAALVFAVYILRRSIVNRSGRTPDSQP